MRRHCEERSALVNRSDVIARTPYGGRSNLFENVATSRGWLTGNVLLPALRAHYARPNSLPTNLSSLRSSQ